MSDVQVLPIPESVPFGPDMQAILNPPELAPDSLAFLRKAINSPTIDEVRGLIKDMALEMNVLNKIELKKDDVVVTLPDEPRHYLFPDILTAVDQNIPVALIGPAGAGKSTVCKQVADALKLKYYLQNAVTGTHELTGYMDAQGRYIPTAFRDAFEKGGLILVDEMDSSDPGALKWMNTALANGYAMFPDHPDPLYKHKDFRVIAAANTYGQGADRMYVGANQLDASTLDRFISFEFRYDTKMELLVAGDPKWTEYVQKVRKAAETENVRIVISPRASIYGAKLLKAGWPWEVVENRTIWKGLDMELRNRVYKQMQEQGPKDGFGQPVKKKAK